MCEEYGDGTINVSQYERWVKTLRNGNYRLQNLSNSGKYVDIDDNVLQNLLEHNLIINSRETGREALICPFSLYRRLRAIQKVINLSQWLPQKHFESSGEQRVTACSSLLSHLTNDCHLRPNSNTKVDHNKKAKQQN